MELLLHCSISTLNHYDKIARVYQYIIEPIESPVRKEGLRALAAKHGEKIIELGFGTGASLLGIAERVGPQGRLYGADSSKKMVEIASNRLAKKQIKHVQLIHGDALKLNSLEIPNHLDAIFMSFFLELLSHSKQKLLLEQCYEKLKVGGRIVVVALSAGSLKRQRLVQTYNQLHRRFPKWLDCKPIKAAQAVRSAGFTVARTDYSSKLVLPVETVLGLKEGKEGG